MTVKLGVAKKNFDKIAQKVIKNNDVAVVELPGGRKVRISPVPQPLYYYGRKKHPVYRAEDLQFLGLPM